MDEYKYYYKGADFYCYPDTKVLINKFGIRDSEQLETVERKITALKTLELEEKPFNGNLDYKYLLSIHHYLFCDLYEWAGKIRVGEFMFKGDSMFFRACYIEQGFDSFYNKLLNENFLKVLDKNKFCERLAYYMGELNALHPFREGNGRTSRLYFKQLAKQAGYQIKFSNVSKDELLNADIAAFNCKYDPLIRVLDKVVLSN
ncbi:MAG: Fic family protein [Oscillospiraceae bacterium]|nr:Fic family protein [Oscillospiraceae bacterium]